MKRTAPLLLALICTGLVPLAHAGVFDDDEARRKILEVQAEMRGKVESLEKRNQAMLDLVNQTELLKAELARLRGQIEVLNNQAEVSDKRQKDFYIDLDSRLRKLEPNAVQVDAATKPVAQATAEETAAYEAALTLFKANNYNGAIKAFQEFLKTYPGGALAPSAQYWVGNSYYALRNYRFAITSQQRVIATWPASPRAADALLSIASSQEELGDKKSARKTLETLIAKYPGTTSAETAKKRLSAG